MPSDHFNRRKFGSRIPVQPTAVARRKTNITGKSSHVGGRPRQNSKIRKKVPHKISKHIVKATKTTIITLK
ncbi:hypothetical protein NQ314_006593 [Rhamnusium bicolor]|uniref:Ribosomal protein S11 n=1 Tax=Rhamnusium bicolor TaxID=1586634 RepID=A0AAV8YZ80_9CUCU|nr:hypothetical protein NQ314_006593 [Rhamnusium bicolor]